MKIIILLGVHGSGKGEQMALLHKNGYVEDVISTGEAYAKFQNPDSKYHKYETDIKPYEHYYAQGKYFPDELTLKIVSGELKSFKYRGLKVVGMEGFPRNIDQAKLLVKTIEELGDIQLKYIFLDLPDEIAMQRLAGRSKVEKRNTDGVDGKRIQLYHQVTDPMVSYLRSLGLVTDVDDRPSIGEVYNLIIKSIS